MRSWLYKECVLTQRPFVDNWETMLCQHCNNNPATVFVSSTRKTADGGSFEKSVQYCAHCADELRPTDPLLNRSLNVPPDAQTIRLRVINVSADHVIVRKIDPGGNTADEMAF